MTTRQSLAWQIWKKGTRRFLNEATLRFNPGNLVLWRKLPCNSIGQILLNLQNFCLSLTCIDNLLQKAPLLFYLRGSCSVQILCYVLSFVSFALYYSLRSTLSVILHPSTFIKLTVILTSRDTSLFPTHLYLSPSRFLRTNLFHFSLIPVCFNHKS